ncbi:MAG: glycosyltransferase family 39 protein [Candidatus Promineifilaceae bacterium]|nr:glycosyltransferase family 39 protein [Candidatus Promineifilaceae bacterium]
MENLDVQSNSMDTSAASRTTSNEELQAEPLLSPAQYESPLLDRLSVADGLYILVIMAAAMIRFVNLDAIPLSPAEASQAFAVWQFAQPNQATLIIESPAYFSLTSVLITLLGSSDTVMRLIPAFFGLGLVLLPWFLRDRLGTLGALVTASFFSVSPLLAVTSRTVGGESIALFALMLIAVAGLKLAQRYSSKWLYVLGAAVGLGLVSAPLIYSGLVTLAAARWTQQKIAPDPSAANRLVRSDWIKATTVGGAVLIAVSTRFFTLPAGIGAVAQLFGSWLDDFQLLGNGQELIEPFLALSRYEAVLLILGIAAIVWAVWRSRPMGTLLTYWLMAALILILLQRGILVNVLIVSLTGYLLLGETTGQLLKNGLSRWSWVAAGVVLFLSALMLVNLARYLRVSLGDSQQLLNIWLALLALAVAAMAVYFFWSIHDRAIIQGSWLGIIILLLLFQWGTAWQLTQISANDPRERWIQQATDDELPVLLDTLEKISQSATNSKYDLELYSAVDSSVLHWYLRDFWQARIEQGLSPGAQYEVIISRADIDQPLLGSDYLGSDFGLIRMGTEQETLSSTPITDALRWWIFHESAAPIAEERIILWVRSDLAYAE